MREGSLFTGWGRQPTGGGKLTTREGGAKSNDPQRRGEPNRTTHKGGRDKSDDPRGGDFFLLGQYFPKPDFYVYGVFWAILIFVSKGQGEKIGRGGGGGSENILDLVIPESLT